MDQERRMDNGEKDVSREKNDQERRMDQERRIDNGEKDV